jgi:perosamine synthetase
MDRDLIKHQMQSDWQIHIDWSYYPPLHLMPVFKRLYGTRPSSLPIAEDLLARIVCLPVHPGISDEDAECVAACFVDIVRNMRGKIS